MKGVMRKGTVFKAFGGYYFVRTEQNDYRCYLRGRFKHCKKQVLVGDKVNIRLENSKEGVIESLEPRTTQLYRPPIANVNLVIIIFSLKQPDVNFYLLDRFLVQSEAAAIRPVICFNKSDLAQYSEVPQIYKKVGYEIIVSSAKTGQGITQLRSILKERISVLAGPSGVGKSSLLNAIQPGLSLKTGDISTKLKRGKHTTRHVELLTLDNGGLVADTPGFSNIYLPAELKIDELANYFPDIHEFAINCRYTGCLHFKEPDCAVKKALYDSKIVATRYEHYIMLLNELMEQERRY